MDNLNQLTADQLLILHNSLCAKANHIKGPWKKSKRKLIELIRILGEPKEEIHREKTVVIDSPESMTTISGCISTLLVTDMSYCKIVNVVRQSFPYAKTSTRSIASIASVMRRQGVKIPWRRNTKSFRQKHGCDQNPQLSMDSIRKL